MQVSVSFLKLILFTDKPSIDEIKECVIPYTGKKFLEIGSILFNKPEFSTIVSNASSWETILEALEGVGLFSLAKDIRENYLTSK